MIGVPYKSEFAQKEYDAIVIGSGISGLSTAALLVRQGKSVLVLEQHYTAGGATHSFKRKGLEWNTGLHYMGEVFHEGHQFRKYFDYISDHKLKWSTPGKVYDRLVFPDQTYDLPTGRDHFIAELKAHFPKEKIAIDRYVKLIFEARRSAAIFTTSKALPQIRGFLKFHPTFSKAFYHTTYDVLSSLTSDPRLIAVLCGQYGNYGLTPKTSSFGIQALVAAHYMEGSCFPIGGAGEIGRTIVDGIVARGGVVAVKADVEKIVVEQNHVVGVRMKNGDLIRAKRIISSVGKDTSALLGQPTERRDEKALSYISLALGIQQPDSVLKHDGANLWIHSSYDLDQNLADYVKNPEGMPPFAYMSFPSFKDPEWKDRIGDKTAVDIIGVAPYEWFEKWQSSKLGRRPEDYEVFKEKITKPYLEKFLEYFPHLRNSVDYVETSSPLTARHYFKSPTGSIYGSPATPEHFRANRHVPETQIEGLSITGQDTLYLGVVGAMMSGVTTMCAIYPLETMGQVLNLGVFDPY